MDNKMVETVAKAIHQSVLDDQLLRSADELIVWEKVDPEVKRRARMLARAAIAAQTPQFGDAIPDSEGWWWWRYADDHHPQPRYIFECGGVLSTKIKVSGMDGRLVKVNDPIQNIGGQWAKATPPVSKGEGK